MLSNLEDDKRSVACVCDREALIYGPRTNGVRPVIRTEVFSERYRAVQLAEAYNERQQAKDL